jgi:hypothetical protein
MIKIQYQDHFLIYFIEFRCLKFLKSSAYLIWLYINEYRLHKSIDKQKVTLEFLSFFLSTLILLKI